MNLLTSVRRTNLVFSKEKKCEQDWGARDPTPGELASDFSEKVLGNWDTEHLIKCASIRMSTTEGDGNRFVWCLV